jgi:hypothetical protein
MAPVLKKHYFNDPQPTLSSKCSYLRVVVFAQSTDGRVPPASVPVVGGRVAQEEVSGGGRGGVAQGLQQQVLGVQERRALHVLTQVVPELRLKQLRGWTRWNVKSIKITHQKAYFLVSIHAIKKIALTLICLIYHRHVNSILMIYTTQPHEVLPCKLLLGLQEMSSLYSKLQLKTVLIASFSGSCCYLTTAYLCACLPQASRAVSPPVGSRLPCRGIPSSQHPGTGTHAHAVHTARPGLDMDERRTNIGINFIFSHDTLIAHPCLSITLD